jgi:hypothetical protein
MRTTLVKLGGNTAPPETHRAPRISIFPQFPRSLLCTWVTVDSLPLVSLLFNLFFQKELHVLAHPLLTFPFSSR